MSKTTAEQENAFEALCEALLMEFGLGETWHGRISDAVDIMSPRARAVLEQLNEDGYTITRPSWRVE